MAIPKASSSATFAALLILTTLAGVECSGKLQYDFYAGKCGRTNVESIVFQVVREKYLEDHTIAPALLRLHFHDCFVRGCDASILLVGNNTEKTARGNGSIRGYEVIDAIKAALERACPGLVSCADIIALAARVAINFRGATWYRVETGRRDGRVSLASEANAAVLGPSTPVSKVINAFAKKGIKKEDVVLLLGGHTIGVTHCFFVEDRLYNFNSTSGRTDPSMNRTLVPILKRACPRNGNITNLVSMDQSKPGAGSDENFLDNGYYKAIVARKGVLEIDQKLALDKSTRKIVSKYAASNALFQIRFGQAMVKLGRIGVLNGTQGEVRKSCRFVN